MVNTMAITREIYEQSFGNLEQSRSISGSRSVSGKMTNIQSCIWSLAFVYTIDYNYLT